MSKVLMVVANQGFRDEEYFIPKEILENNSISVVTSALEEGTAQGAMGKTTEVNLKLDYFFEEGEEEERVGEYDAIVFIGGQGMVELTDEERFHELAQRFKAANKVVAAICVAPVILAKAGVLKDKTATVYPDQENIDILVNQYAEYSDEEAVVDGKIVTAAGPKAAYKFGMELVKQLS